jgi:hypothetical protein
MAVIRDDLRLCTCCTTISGIGVCNVVWCGSKAIDHGKIPILRRHSQWQTQASTEAVVADLIKDVSSTIEASHKEARKSDENGFRILVCPLEDIITLNRYL